MNTIQRVEDRRTDEERAATGCYAVATDALMSGWGKAKGGRSLYALACATVREAEIVAENLRRRGEMKRVRIVRNLPRLRAGDHLSIAGRTAASRHYMEGGF